MEIQVKVVKILDAQRFVSKKDGSEIVKNTFVGETQGQYPKNIAFSVMGADKFAGMAITVGGTYNVSFDVESREWQGKWFTEASAWRAQRMDVNGQQQENAAATTTTTHGNTTLTQAPVQQQPTQQAVKETPKDDLPF